MTIKQFKEYYLRNSRGAGIWLKNHPDFINLIRSHLSCFDLDLSHATNRELSYILVNNITKLEKCKSCDRPQKFSSSAGHYAKTCGSKECIKIWKNTDEYRDNLKNTNRKKYGVDSHNQNIHVKNKKKQSYIVKYGVDNPSKSDLVIDKIRQTSISKYGVDNPAKSSIAKQSYKETCNQKYGFDSHLNDINIRNKIYNTCIDKYGVDNPFKLNEIQDRIKSTLLKRYGNTSYKKSDKFKENLLLKLREIYPNILEINDSFTYTVKCNILNCDCGGSYEITKHLYYQRMNIYKTEPCIFANPIISNTSSYELELYDFLKNQGIHNLVKNDRSSLNSKEIDIYLPEYKLGIEINGVYWHSELHKEKGYHQQKSILANERGVSLFHIWEDDWVYKRPIIESMIRSKLGLLEKIGGRKCQIKKVSTSDARKFLEENHLQGSTNSSVRIGLYYKDDLVSLMTLGKLRKAVNQKDIEGEWELYRFASKLNLTVHGGFTRLLNWFIDNYSPSKIHTYASLDHSNGGVYIKSGFTLDHMTPPGYWWVVNGIRKHRFNFRKDLLVKSGEDPAKTESQIMYERGHYRLWDSGNLKFTKTFN